MTCGEKGQALPLTLVLLTVGTLLAVPFLSQASSHLIGSRVYGQAISQQYAADAGIEYGIWHLLSGTSVVPPGEQVELAELTVNDNTVNVTIENQGSNIYRITSLATAADGSSITIEARFHYLPASFDPDSFEYFPGDFELDKDEEHSGDIYVQGRIKLENRATLTGNAYAEGNVELGNHAEVTGDVFTEANIQLENHTQINGSIVAGQDVQLENHAVIEGEVCAGGDVRLENHAQINGDVYAAGNVQLENHAQINGNVYAGQDVEIGKHATITGTIYPYSGCQVSLGSETVKEVLSWEIR